MKKVAVGSKNPVKINAVRLAFKKLFPDETFEVIGIEVDSGVPSQPMSDKESIRGAKNRAKRSMKQLKADFGVGLEGGIQKIGKNYFDSGWMVIIDQNGYEGIGSTVKAPIPKKIMDLILYEDHELGSAGEKIYNIKNLKQKEGHFGIMSKGHITRTSGYVDGLIMALAPFVHKDLFSE